ERRGLDRGQDGVPVRRCRGGPAAVHAPEVPGRIRIPRPREAVLAPGGEDLRRSRTAGEDAEWAEPAEPLCDLCGWAVTHDQVVELLISGVKIFVICGGLQGLFSVMTWVERRTLAFMQFRLGPNRTGPAGILQPVADGIKLFFKEEFIPPGADKWLFIAAPAV